MCQILPPDVALPPVLYLITISILKMRDDDSDDSDETESDLVDPDEKGKAKKIREKRVREPSLPVPAAPATYFVVDSFNIHRLIIAGVTCASKFFSDVFYTNSRYAKVRCIYSRFL